VLLDNFLKLKTQIEEAANLIAASSISQKIKIIFLKNIEKI